MSGLKIYTDIGWVLVGGGGGGIALTVTDGIVTVANVSQITLRDGTVVNSGGGAVTIGMDYILVRDEKPAGTSGGTMTAGAWHIRDINTEVSDLGGHCSIASNQITLAAGTYECRIIVPGYQISRHKAILYNVTDSLTQLVGSNHFAGSGIAAGNDVNIIGRFTISASKIFEIRHRCEATQATYGFGVEGNFGEIEIYTIAEFWKVR